MKKVLIILLILLAIAGVGYYGWQQYQQAQTKLWEEKAQLAEDTLKPIKMQFKETLMSGMQQGVVEAIDYCNLKAPEITAKVPKGVEVGRTSHRVRNPENEPTDLLQAPLDYYLEMERLGKETSGQITQLPSGDWLYVEPIYTQPVCLACHGENIAPEVQTAINEKYPNDQATGFKEGELRGMFWLKLAEDFGAQN